MGHIALPKSKLHGNNLKEFITDLEMLLPDKWVNWAINAFSDVAMTTSCLGVSLGLFDFLADGLSRKKTPSLGASKH